jgi:hypothetical protein
MTMIVLAITVPSYFFFPALLGYVAYGVGKALVLGFFERMPDRGHAAGRGAGRRGGRELRDIDYRELSPWQRFRLQRPRRHGRPI